MKKNLNRVINTTNDFISHVQRLQNINANIYDDAYFIKRIKEGYGEFYKTKILMPHKNARYTSHPYYTKVKELFVKANEQQS